MIRKLLLTLPLLLVLFGCSDFLKKTPPPPAQETAGPKNKEEAQAILDEPDFVPMPTVKADIPKVDNRLFRKVWKFRIVDEGQIPRQYMTPDMVKIGGVVRAMKGVTNIPGIQVYEE